MVKSHVSLPAGVRCAEWVGGLWTEAAVEMDHTRGQMSSKGAVGVPYTRVTPTNVTANARHVG